MPIRNGGICHVTTAHPVDDVRIFHKECVSAATEGFEVSLVGPDDGPARCVSDVQIIPLRRARSRYDRAVKLTREALRAALATGANVFHFHDPELIPVGLALRARGKQVIYDVHESLPKSVLSKPYLAPVVRRPVALGAHLAEAAMARAATAIVAATPAIADQFTPSKTIAVQNFPLLSELVALSPRPFSERPLSVVYTGGISAIRGAVEMVEAIGQATSGSRLALVGKFNRADIEAEATALEGWQHVDYHGWQPRTALPGLFNDARAGLVLFHPEPNHIEAMPNKLFEYMSASLPVIASDFPLWRSIVEGVGCGLLVDPQDPAAIARAIDWVVTHPDEAEAMGRRGRAAVEEKYNWGHEATKLISLYQRLVA